MRRQASDPGVCRPHAGQRGSEDGCPAHESDLFQSAVQCGQVYAGRRPHPGGGKRTNHRPEQGPDDRLCA